jgi:ornithine cyclodeaminase/alanine dehydrogenase-like protein (mu-crystallin family)
MRYLSRQDTIASMPELAVQLELAEAALRAVDDGAEVPGKVAVHPSRPASIAYAMPASLRTDVASISPVLGMKWVTVFPGNSDLGVPAINGLIILNDPDTTAPVAVLEASAITAARTAAVSGSIFRHLGPAIERRPYRVALVGAGVQGRSHVPMLGHLAPGLELSVFDRHPERARALATEANSTPGIGSVRVAESAAEATRQSDIVVTAVSFGPIRQVMTSDWLSPEALVIAVDYEMYASAEVAGAASAFLVDERGGYDNAREEGRFVGFPAPSSTIGAFYRSGTTRPSGRVLAVHLGMGLTDVIFAAAVSDLAARRGVGVELSASGAPQ